MERLIGRKGTSTIITGAGTALAANKDRVDAYIQNLSNVKAYVKLGPSCSTSDFSFVLAAATGTDDGTVLPRHIPNYTGEISVATASTIRVSAVETVN